MKLLTPDDFTESKREYPHCLTTQVESKDGPLTVNIMFDENPMNPFEEWDCEPPLMARFDGGETDYSGDYGPTPVDDITLTDEQLLDNLDTIARLFGYDDAYDYFDAEGCYDELYSGSIYDADGPTLDGVEFNDELDWLRGDISEQDFYGDRMEAWEVLCDIARVPCLNTTVTGYSQSDWADLFIWLPDEWFEKTGAFREQADTILESAKELYGDWAFGNVFGFVIEDKEGNVLESCFGFYGMDMDANGLLQTLNDTLEDMEE